MWYKSFLYCSELTTRLSSGTLVGELTEGLEELRGMQPHRNNISWLDHLMLLQTRLPMPTKERTRRDPCLQIHREQRIALPDHNRRVGPLSQVSLIPQYWGMLKQWDRRMFEVGGAHSCKQKVGGRADKDWGAGGELMINKKIK